MIAHCVACNFEISEYQAKSVIKSYILFYDYIINGHYFLQNCMKTTNELLICIISPKFKPLICNANKLVMLSKHSRNKIVTGLVTKEMFILDTDYSSFAISYNCENVGENRRRSKFIEIYVT